MRPLGGVVGRALRVLGLESDVADARALAAWPPAAAAVIGPDAERTRAVRIEGTTLVIAVPSSVWAAEIRLREATLVGAIRDRVSGSRVRRIRAVPDGSPRLP